MSRPDQGHACTLCGRRCRYARSVCSTCRVGTGIELAARPRGWASEYYPARERCDWPSHLLSNGHAAYARGLRDPLTVARETEYQRRQRERRARAS